jgi:hypothetical protein
MSCVMNNSRLPPYMALILPLPLAGSTSLEWACHCFNRATLLRVRLANPAQSLPLAALLAVRLATSEADRGSAVAAAPRLTLLGGLATGEQICALLLGIRSSRTFCHRPGVLRSE